MTGKPRSRIIRTEPSRSVAGRTDTIWQYVSGPDHREVAAWRRCNPSIGRVTDIRDVPGAG